MYIHIYIYIYVDINITGYLISNPGRPSLILLLKMCVTCNISHDCRMIHVDIPNHQCVAFLHSLRGLKQHSK